ncbi:TonB-dependent receptor [soil metagenome]
MRPYPRILMIFAACVPSPGQQPAATPAEIREEVLVTTDRIDTRIGDTPASVVSLSSREIRSTASPVMDDILRQSVGFSIFRRSSSRNANPTTQGVSLRGVGSSGASRSAIFFDGVPLNDPFGGWVQWNRVSPIAVENVEVLRGGASSLYGNAGLSGAINVKPREVNGKYLFSADVFGGTQGTLSGSVFTGFRARQWRADASVASFQTEGYKPVDEAVRGPVDAFAGVRSTNLNATLTRDIGQSSSLFFRPSYFGEVRTNGTGLQTNRTHVRQAVAGGDILLKPSRDLKISWRGFAGTQVFDQVFSAVNAGRTAETVTRVQRSPSQNAGLSAYGSFIAGNHVILAGTDIRIVRGSSDEIAFVNRVPTAFVDAGGRENTAGVYVQDFVRFRKRIILAGRVRFDRWRNYAGQSANRPLTVGHAFTTTFPDRNEGAWSPHIAALYHLTDELSFYGSASRSFRSPTLNELYRGFRVGHVVTLANENLVAERAINAEAGAAFSRKGMSIRASVFRTEIDGAVGNITLMVTPNLITRQRQNAGLTRSRGVEVEGEVRFRQFDVSAGYLFADSTVVNFPTNTTIEGLRVPQVPRHQFTAQIRYTVGQWTLAMQARASGEQFDDDLNQFRLEPFGQADVFISRRMTENLQIYGAVENVFNSRYSIGRTLIRTVSSPSNMRVGVRWK